MTRKRTLGVVLFEGFELLDVFGPLEMFGLAADHFEIRLIAENGGVVASRQGPKSVCDDSFQSAPAIDVLLVPGQTSPAGQRHRAVQSPQTAPRQGFVWIAWVIRPLNGITAVVTDAECRPEARQDGGQRLEWSAKPNACWAA